MPLHISSTCVHHQQVKIALHNLWYYHTYRRPSGAQVERGKQAKQVNQYKNTKIKLYKSNAAIWCNKTCRIKQLIPTYAVLSQPVHKTATYRCDDTRGCVMQF